MFYYVDSTTKIFALASRDALPSSEPYDPVPIAPPNGRSRWNGSGWEEVTEVELGIDKRIQTHLTVPTETAADVIVAWADGFGKELKKSLLKYFSGRFLMEGILDLVSTDRLPIAVNGIKLSLSNFLPLDPNEGDLIEYSSGAWRASKPKFTWAWNTSISNANVPNNNPQRRQNGTPTTSNPYTIPMDCYARVVTVENNITDTKEARYAIYKNNQLFVTFTKAAGLTEAVFDNLNLEFSKGDRISILTVVGGAQRIAHPGGGIYFIQK